MVLVALAGFVLVSARSLPAGAAIFPNLAGGGLMVVSLLALWLGRHQRTKPQDRNPAGWAVTARFFALLVALCAGLYLIGAIPASFLLVTVIMRRFGRVGWGATLATALGVAGLVHLVFDRLIHVAWPAPLLL